MHCVNNSIINENIVLRMLAQFRTNKNRKEANKKMTPFLDGEMLITIKIDLK